MITLTVIANIGIATRTAEWQSCLQLAVEPTTHLAESVGWLIISATTLQQHNDQKSVSNDDKSRLYGTWLSGSESIIGDEEMPIGSNH